MVTTTPTPQRPPTDTAPRPRRADIPLALWLLGAPRPSLDGTPAALLSPALAERVINEYSSLGQLVSTSRPDGGEDRTVRAAATGCGRTYRNHAGQPVELIITAPSGSESVDWLDPALAGLRPGGLLVTITQNQPDRGRLHDHAATLVRQAQAREFGYLQHVVAVLADVTDSRLVPPITPDGEGRRGSVGVLVVHADVCVFRTPTNRPAVIRDGSGPMTESPRLSVWPTAQQTSRLQRAARYLPSSVAHPAKMLPAVAATAIRAYSQPGDLVLDPMCGIGTTLVEATHLGRDAVGIEYEPQWAEHAAANLAHAKGQGASGEGRVLVGDARRLDVLLDPDQRGRVALVLTSPPYGATLHGQVQARPGAGVHKTHDRYSHDRANLAHIGHARLLEAMIQVLTAAARALRPGGVVAMIVRPYWHAGQLVDLPGHLVDVGQDAGLDFVERNVVLLAALRGEGQIVPRTSFFALDQTRKARGRGISRSVVAHEDLLVFRAPWPR